ncbi:hypothetical protein CPB83DRAFT_863948 [Crepidotus variabilis]|uniref:Uncharacterized protein n=1 Tax=Crepidotus variabilis TaxID=179855 RepID=A0A9P6E577_9AGAR|nr:hypothetical protein CPB83DRAFT_863948 [Crepidotus variabilis]
MDQNPTVPLATERGFYIGNTVSCILYGINIYLCFQTIYYLRARRISAGRASFFTFFSLWTTALMAIGLACNVVYGQYVWIEGRNDYPGGPGEYFLVNTGWWVNTFGSASAVVTSITSDGLMLYRCFVILDRSIWGMILPTLLYLGSIALGMIYVILSALPNSFVFGGKTAQFVVAWTSVSVSFNVVVTMMISARLLYARRELYRSGSRDHNDPYTNVVAILVESAFPLALSGLLAAVFYGIEHPAAFIFMIIWSFFVAAAPQVIIMRVAMGKAWTRETTVSHLKFQTSEKSMKYRTQSSSGNKSGTLVAMGGSKDSLEHIRL